MSETQYASQDAEVMLALAVYRAKYKYIEETISGYGRHCKRPMSIEELQRSNAKFIKRNLSDVVSQIRDEKL